jgi:tRNA modification GTPase
VYPTDDTIVAVATPAGHGGVGVVRLSGERAEAIGLTMARRATVWTPRVATRARLDGDGLRAEALVTLFPGPKSYTGDDVVEFSAHGSPVLLAGLVQRAVALGARHARAGEFTLRAFLNGKLDLVQAEAARDLVEAVSPAQARAAFDQLDGTLSSALQAMAAELRELELKLEASMDFPDEGYHFIEPGDVATALQGMRARLARLVDGRARGQLVREGARIVIAGTPNAGKSSLFNTLVGADRAIVAATPGTTRDLVSARLVLGDYVAELVDTAGLRASDDAVEQEGVRRAGEAMDHAHAVIVAIDGSRPVLPADRAVLARAAGGRVILAVTKADLPAAWPLDDVDADALAVSARTGAGVGEVIARVIRALHEEDASADHVLVTNQRHGVLLAAALSHVEHALAQFESSGGALPEEFVAADVQLALGALDEVTGRRTSEGLLHEIFARFCIGK